MAMRILRKAEVTARTGLSLSTIYNLIGDGRFPKSVPLSVRARGWLEHEVDAWIEERATNREDAPSGQPPELVRHIQSRAAAGR